MSFTIPNHPAAANPNPQSIWFESDIAALVQGFAGQGVVSGCAVSPQSPEALGVLVAVGTVRVGGVVAAVSPTNVALSTADPDHPRVDLIVSDNAGVLSVIVGTPAPIGTESGPAAPALPSDRVLLAMVLVDALDVTIPAGQIVDKRVGVVHASEPRSVAINATARVGDSVIICTAALTLTLYPVANNAGRQIRVINDSVGDLVVDGDGAETVGGQATVTVPAGGTVAVFCTGSKWLISG